jgi:hypothetical protein
MSLAVDTLIIDIGDGSFGLRVASQDEETFAFFNDQDLLGDGCTWQAVVDALVRAQMPDEGPQMEFTCEAESLLIMSQDEALLKRVESLVLQAAQSEEAILDAIANADPDLLE